MKSKVPDGFVRIPGLWQTWEFDRVIEDDHSYYFQRVGSWEKGSLYVIYVSEPARALKEKAAIANAMVSILEATEEALGIADGDEDYTPPAEKEKMAQKIKEKVVTKEEAKVDGWKLTNDMIAKYDAEHSDGEDRPD